MKKIFITIMLAIVVVCSTINAQNIFPSTGRAGIYTTSPAASLQVRGGARIGTTANYVNIDSATGNLSFVGTSAYRVAGNKYAFQYSGNTNYGLFFNSTNVQYEFRNGSAVPVFAINANTGNSVFNGTLKVGAYTLPATDGANGQVLKTNGSGTLSWSNTAASGWSLTGNAGTDSSINFLGTSDAHPLAFRVNNQKSAWIDFTFKANTSFGYQGLLSNTIGIDNTAIGYNSLKANTSGLRNTAVGSHALEQNTATNNTAIGSTALEFNTDGSENIAVGTGSLTSNTSGYGNTAMGFNSLNSNLTGEYNTALGFSALSGNGNGDNGNISGGGNVAVGSNALQTNESGSSNTGVGYYSNASATNLNNASALGAFAVVNASNKIRLGDVNITVVESQVGSWTTSDGRFKNNIKENVKGLEFIKLLRPVTYNFDTRKFEEFLMQNYPDSIKAKRMARFDSKSMSKASGIMQTGFIAQDVATAAKKIGYDFNGVHAPENPTDNWSLSYEKLVVPLVKAVQELSKMNDDKDARINNLQKQIDELKAMMVSNQSSVNNQQAVSISSASLQQNIPNPFTNTTSIAYTLPQKFTSAQIVIADKNGKTLKAIVISGNKGNVKVDASTLSSGAYQYSLIVDGRVIDTKQMLLAK